MHSPTFARAWPALCHTLCAGCRTEACAAHDGRQVPNKQRAKPQRARDSGSPLKQLGAASTYATTSAATAHHMLACRAASQAATTAGRPLAQAPDNHIIHGGAASSNNAKFECYVAGARVHKARVS